MPKRPFPRPGVCLTGVRGPVTMAIPFSAADTGVHEWPVADRSADAGKPQPAQKTTTAVLSPGRDWPRSRVSESSGDRRPGVPGASSSSVGPFSS
jgi:hypothetical protein